MAEQTAADTSSDPDNQQPIDDTAALKSELEQMRRDLVAARSGQESERSARVQAEQRGLSEAEKRLLAEEAANSTSISSLNSEADTIEADIARLADEPGHGAEIAKLNRRLATVCGQLQTAENRKSYLEGQRERAKAAPAETGPKLASGASLSNFAPAVQKWFESHPRVFTDKGYLDKVVAADMAARNLEGFTANTPEYFEYIEQRVDGTSAAAPARVAPMQDNQDEGEELTTEVRNPQHRAAGPGSMRAAVAAVAAPSRQAASPSGNGPRRQAMLTAQEREVADSLYSDVANPADRYARYAKGKEYMKNRDSRGFGAN